MSIKIRRATVLGAGVMGAQIAAHLAAAGVRVNLLDLASDEPPEDPKQAKAVGKGYRSARAILALHNLKKLKPSPLMSESFLQSVIPGNFDDDLSVVADADWVIEAVIERQDIKVSLHKKLAEYVRPNIPVTTNTSGIPLQAIAEELPEGYRGQFFATHFFNPPRYMHLMEVVPLPETNQELMTDLCQWISESLGKGVVFGFDTVNFIANRIGVYNLQVTAHHMEDLGLNIETVDALTGKLIGRPPSASMRTLDVVGLDTYAHVSRNVYDRATNDPLRESFLTPKWIQDLIDKGHLGQKSGQGCYAKTKDEKGRRKILAYRPETGEYAEQEVADLPWLGEAKKQRGLFGRLNLIIAQEDPGSKLIWRMLRDTMLYSAALVEEIAGGEPKRIDDAMKWGFNWEFGPFELWQGMGFDTILEKMKSDGVSIPDWVKPGTSFYQPAPNAPERLTEGYKSQLNVAQGKQQDIHKPNHKFNLPNQPNSPDQRVIDSNPSATLLDIGEGIACLSFHTKMNAIDLDLLKMIQSSVTTVREKYRGLVIANEGAAFSAGANLKYILGLIDDKNWTAIDELLRQFQGSVQLLKYAPFPVVSCPFGMTLGGGCEVALHTPFKVLAAETYAGLVEMGVGLIPAGGGTKELAVRAYRNARLGDKADPMPFLQRAFMLIGQAQVSTSGFHAKDMGLFPGDSYVAMSREHQTLKAKGLAFQMDRMGYSAPVPESAISVVGDPGIQTFKMILYNMLEGGYISEHDALIGEKIATVLCGGEVDSGTRVDEQFLLDLERRVFIDLCKEPKTRERIEHMLKKGKPLRN